MDRPVVAVASGAVPPWAHRLGGASIGDALPDPERIRAAPSVWIDGALDGPLEVARRARTADPAVQIGVVAADEDREALERRLIFTPGLGEIWIVGPGEVNPGLIARAAEVSRTRRAYRVSRSRLTAASSDLHPAGRRRAVVTDAFLAALLQVLPDPVVSIDEVGEVVSWSPAAERMTGRTSSEATGRPIGELFAVHPPEALDRLLEFGARSTSRAELVVTLPEGDDRVIEVVVTPVTAERIHVRVLVLRDLTDERRVQDELRRAMEIRGRFFASMSHEIRTPINAILGYNDLLLSGAVGDVGEALIRHIERSQAAARHLLELVNDVLDLSKIEAGKIQLQFEDTATGDLMRELEATVLPLAEQQDTPLVMECERSDLRFRSDPRRIKQILLNLVSNAVKFGRGQPVAVRCRTQDGGIAFEVQDRGVGISPEDQERVFDEFTQLGVAEGGTGLGLPISKRLAEILGGSLTVQSEPGVGSTFTLVLPPEPPTPAPE